MFNLIKGLADPATAKKTPVNLTKLAKAVLWSFFGVRKMKNLDSDATSISPLQVIVAGVIGAAVLVLSLVLLVRHIVA